MQVSAESVSHDIGGVPPIDLITEENILGLLVTESGTSVNRILGFLGLEETGLLNEFYRASILEILEKAVSDGRVEAKTFRQRSTQYRKIK